MFLEHKHLLRQKYAMDPPTPADYLIPLGKAATVRAGRRPDDRDLGRDGAEVAGRGRAARRQTVLSVEVIDLRSPHALGQGGGRRVGGPHFAPPRGARGRAHERLRGGGGGLGGGGVLRRTSTRRSRGWARPTPSSPTSRRWSGRSCPRPTASPPPPARCSPIDDLIGSASRRWDARRPGRPGGPPGQMVPGRPAGTAPRVPGTCVLVRPRRTARSAETGAGHADGKMTQGEGAPSVGGGCEGKGDEDARPRAKAGASGLQQNRRRPLGTVTTSRSSTARDRTGPG